MLELSDLETEHSDNQILGGLCPSAFTGSTVPVCVLLLFEKVNCSVRRGLKNLHKEEEKKTDA